VIGPFLPCCLAAVTPVFNIFEIYNGVLKAFVSGYLTRAPLAACSSSF
jgi:hypothetical protein